MALYKEAPARPVLPRSRLSQVKAYHIRKVHKSWRAKQNHHSHPSTRRQRNRRSKQRKMPGIQGAFGPCLFNSSPLLGSVPVSVPVPLTRPAQESRRRQNGIHSRQHLAEPRPILPGPRRHREVPDAQVVCRERLPAEEGVVCIQGQQGTVSPAQFAVHVC